MKKEFDYQYKQLMKEIDEIDYAIYEEDRQVQDCETKLVKEFKRHSECLKHSRETLLSKPGEAGQIQQWLDECKKDLTTHQQALSECQQSLSKLNKVTLTSFILNIILVVVLIILAINNKRKKKD